MTVHGIGGAPDHGSTLSFAPRLPDGLTSISFTVVRRGKRLRVGIGASATSDRLLDAHGKLDLLHYGERLVLVGTKPVERPIP